MQACLLTAEKTASAAALINGAADGGAWNCVNCWQCVEACPQGVDLYAFMMAKRRTEDVPGTIRRLIDNIVDNGISSPVPAVDQIRAMHGLPRCRLIERYKLEILLNSV